MTVPHPSPRTITLPRARGPLTERLFATLAEPPGTSIARHPGELRDDVADPLADDDVQLALYVGYELHYGAIAGVDPDWEWDPCLLTFLAPLERSFEAATRARAGADGDVAPSKVREALHALAAADDDPPLARWVETRADDTQLRELLVHRSACQLEEADPHAWAIPRLTDGPRAALVAVERDQHDGSADRGRSELFAEAMAAIGLDPRHGAYLHRLPAATLATVNLTSLLGLHRRLRGAVAGHLAASQLSSPEPDRRYANGLRRLGHGPDATAFFDAGAEADAGHAHVAVEELAGGLAAAEPELVPDILFGARARRMLDARWSAHLLAAWQRGESSLHPAF